MMTDPISDMLTRIRNGQAVSKAAVSMPSSGLKTAIARVLKDEGYRAGAAISAFVLDSQYGIDKGFDVYDDDLTVGIRYSPQMFRERAAELTNQPVRAWLRANADERFFFWVMLSTLPSFLVTWLIPLDAGFGKKSSAEQ